VGQFLDPFPAPRAPRIETAADAPSATIVAVQRRHLPALLATAAVALGALGLALLLAGSSSRSGSAPASSPPRASGAAFVGAALPAGLRAPDFTLADQSARPVSLSEFRGRVVVLSFVATSCGSACMLLAQQIRGALDELAPPPAVLLVSADPSGDTRARIARFLERVSLSGRAHYLTASAQALQPIWRSYGVQPITAGRAAFERSAEVRLIDAGGRERVVFGLEQLTPEGLAHDVRKLW
jgi:protein SCO1